VSDQNPLQALSTALNALGLEFVIVGSHASSARGVPRFTRDVDLIVRMAPFHAEKLSAALGRDWYADPEQMRDAIRAGRAFNIIHMPTGLKLDLFPVRTEFQESEMRRATPEPVTINNETVICPVSSPEDIILAKLRWYKDGAGVSEVQWRDIGGVIAVNPSLDLDYLRLWAGRLQVTELLEKALSEARID
jgi:hypothetical protein